MVNKFIVGVDEVGRGPIAGPIYSAAFATSIKKLIDLKNQVETEILNQKLSKLDYKRLKRLLKLINYDLKRININNKKNVNANKHNFNLDILKHLQDSKKITKINKNLLAKYSNEVGEFSIKKVEACKIDLVGIQKANVLCMTHCVRETIKKVGETNIIYIFSDKTYGIPNYWKIIKKGDSKSFVIAYASVIAKVARDKLMISLHKKYPKYGWETNVGYGTKKHVEAIKKYGITKIHRKSFINKK